MDVSVIFPFVYCTVALMSLVLYVVAFASHKYIGFIYYRKHPDARQELLYINWYAGVAFYRYKMRPDARQEASNQKMTPRRIVFVIIASALLIADIVTLAVLNYNFYYWLKVFITIAVLAILLTLFCAESLFGGIGSFRKIEGLIFGFLFIGGIVTAVLLAVSIPASEKKETVEITDLSPINQEHNVFVVVEDEGATYHYCKKNDNLQARESSVYTKVYLQYAYYEYDPPYVVERYQTPIRKYKIYGKEQELVGEKQLTQVEIHTPKKFVLELDTQRKT